MVTGDHKVTGLAIARTLGIAGPGDLAIDGVELEAMTDAALASAIERIRVFARVHPAQKLRIVEAYQRRGEVVAMTGDGDELAVPERSAAGTPIRASAAQIGRQGPGSRTAPRPHLAESPGSVLANHDCMDRNTIRNQLLAQHERIRQDVATCRVLAEWLRGGEPVERAFELARARLRADFDEHNRTETGLLLPLLLPTSHGSETRGALLAERMLEEHAAEHDAFWKRIDRPLHDVAACMDELIEELEAHMAAEERTFLSPLILRGDNLGGIVSR
jgi:hypothetical protein